MFSWETDSGVSILIFLKLTQFKKRASKNLDAHIEIWNMYCRIREKQNKMLN